MGCIYLIIKLIGDGNINIEYTKSFMSMKKRGIDNTIMKKYETIPITRLNENIVRNMMSKREIKEYKQMEMIVGNHRMRINDDSYDGDQPFEYPIEHLKTKYKELQTETKKVLICDGEIYNYEEIKKDEGFEEKDLQSNSDVEIIMPMYKKYGIIETIKRIKGEYNFIIIDNWNTLKYDEINITICRDIFGSRSLYYVKDLQNFMYMFVSELKGIPKHIKENKKRYEIGEFPNGCIWNFEREMITNRNMIEFYKYDEIKKQEIIYNKTDEETLNKLYTEMYKKIEESIKEKIPDSRNISIFIDGNITSILILVILFTMEGIKIDIYTQVENELIIEKIKHINKKMSNVNIHIIKIEDKKEKSKEEIKEIIETDDIRIIKSCIKYNNLCKYKKTMNKNRIIMIGYGLKIYYKDKTTTQEECIKEMIEENKMKYLNKIACYWDCEFRYPYMNKEIIEIILSIEGELKKNIQVKEKEYSYYLIRKMMEIKIPEYKELYYLV
jgi:asparagine synthase (glutamine-hydrolysing)